jgi:hypothetical protein
MSDRKIKTTTLKRLSRKVRGIENMMWAVIGTVLVVVVAFVMWNIFSSSASTINAPQIQLVPQESYVISTTAYVTLKFGKGFKNVQVSLKASQGTSMTDLASCSPYDPQTTDVYEGQKVTYQCTNLQSTPGVMYVVVKWDGGSTTIKWVVG